MNIRKKYLLIVALLLVPVGLYTVSEAGAAESVVATGKVTPGLSASELMRSMNMTSLNDPQAAPDFNLSSIGDNKVRLSEYRGKVILLSFWATW